MHKKEGKYADYYTLNWGSISPEILGSALIAFVKEKIQKPMFLKLPADAMSLQLPKLPVCCKPEHTLSRSIRLSSTKARV